MYREMLIKIENGDTSIAFVADRQLTEIHLPREQDEQLLGNIYLGRIENVLPGMQAAFVDIGQPRNCFLYVEDAYLPPTVYGGKPIMGKPIGEKQITDLVKKNQQVIIQVFKEPSGTKGARVTMQPSLPGRYLVLLPCGDYIAISRRIEDEDERERLKVMVKEALPSNMGAIIRTVAAGATQEVISADIRLLVKEWRRIQGLAAKVQPPTLIHRDLELLKRIVRDTNTGDIDRIVCDSQETAETVADVIAAIAPSLDSPITVSDNDDLFAGYCIHEQVEKALRRKVWLKSGGYIVFDQTEALNAIDVNTGKYVGECSLHDTVLKTNLEAVTEIARQLRLRNLGGIIIVDFIDMEKQEDKDLLLEALIEELKKDRIRVTVMGMTQLGLVEMTRKKVGQELSAVIEKECPVCNGKGRILASFEQNSSSVDKTIQM